MTHIAHYLVGALLLSAIGMVFAGWPMGLVTP